MASSKVNDGGPAFARSGFEATTENVSAADTQPQDGMTLRDYFAAHAPAPPQWWLDHYRDAFAKASDLPTAAQHVAQWRWAYADAMLAERNKDAPAARAGDQTAG